MVPTDGSVTSSKLQIHVSKQCPGGFGGGGGVALPLFLSSPPLSFSRSFPMEMHCIYFFFLDTILSIIRVSYSHIPRKTKTKTRCE
jgi:hypothetical protein